MVDMQGIGAIGGAGGSMGMPGSPFRCVVECPPALFGVSSRRCASLPCPFHHAAAGVVSARRRCRAAQPRSPSNPGSRFSAPRGGDGTPSAASAKPFSSGSRFSVPRSPARSVSPHRRSPCRRRAEALLRWPAAFGASKPFRFGFALFCASQGAQRGFPATTGFATTTRATGTRATAGCRQGLPVRVRLFLCPVA